LTELAVQLADEVEGLSSDDASPEERAQTLDATLRDAVRFLAELKGAFEERKLVAHLKRTSDDKTSEQDANVLFEELVKKNQSTNLRRLGPVKRGR